MPAIRMAVGVAFWVGPNELRVLRSKVVLSLCKKCPLNILPMLAWLGLRLLWNRFAFSHAETSCQAEIMLKALNSGIMHCRNRHTEFCVWE